MSSDPRSDARSPEPERSSAGPSDADLVRERGADLLGAVEARLPGARAHAGRVASWALALAVELGLDREGALTLREASRLHGIGMLYLPPELVGRQEWELSPEELRRYDEQAEAAGRLAAGAGIPTMPTTWLTYWRERYDGRGPYGLAADAIPLESRIIRVACAYDLGGHVAPSSGGPDVGGQTMNWLGGLAGAELDPAVVHALGNVVARTG
jgi:HD-GYP domain-containing protein (c-di-GMP phosphodiesterase class II)